MTALSSHTFPRARRRPRHYTTAIVFEGGDVLETIDFAGRWICPPAMIGYRTKWGVRLAHLVGTVRVDGRPAVIRYQLGCGYEPAPHR